MAVTGRRGFLVASGSALLGATAMLGSPLAAGAARATTDPSKPPLDVRIANVSGNTITLAWNQPPDHMFTYVYDNNAPEYFFGGYLSTGVTLKRMQSGMTHTFTVVYGDPYYGDPRNAPPDFSFSPPSAPVQVTLAPSSDTTPPTPPTNVRDTTTGDGTEFVTEWDPSTDDVTPQDQIQYDVLGYGFTTAYGVTSPAQGTADGIRAVDLAGNRSAVARAS